MSFGVEQWSTLESELQFVLGELKEQTGPNDELLEEGYGLVERMAAEVQGLPTADRSQYSGIVREYRAEIDQAKRAMYAAAAGAARSELFGDRDAAADRGSDQRAQLLSNQQRLEQSSDRLRDAQRVGNETEAIGAGILNDLRGQREQILNSRNTLAEADSAIDRSMRTLRGMARRMAANKLLSYAIIAVLVILIIFVLASKFM